MGHSSRKGGSGWLEQRSRPCGGRDGGRSGSARQWLDQGPPCHKAFFMWILGNDSPGNRHAQAGS